MPTNGDAPGQVPPISSPDGNGQVPPTSHSSSDGDDNANGDEHPEPSSKLTYEQLQDRNKKLAAENAKRRLDDKELAELRAYKQQQEDAKLSADEKRDKALAEAQQ